jgi:hypothetical protein
MNYIFLCEFTELRSAVRSVRAQGGGVHGNGILTRLEVLSAECVSHSHHPVDWSAGKHHFAQCVLPLPQPLPLLLPLL